MTTLPASQIVNIDPEIMSGEPVFAGTRVPVRTLFDWLTDACTLDEFLDNFPSVTREQAIAFLEQSTTEYVERHGASAAR